MLGRADRFVETQPRFVPLATRLLGQTWIVEKLAHAMQLAPSLGRGLDFVTLAGDVLQADGTMVVGPRQATSGLISRRSQLRALTAQLAELQAKAQQAQAAIASLQAEIAQRQREVELSAEEHRAKVEALSEHRLKLSAAEERRSQFDQQRATADGELKVAAKQHETAQAQLTRGTEKRHALDQALAVAEKELSALGEELLALEAQCQAQSRQATEGKVALAKSEERFGALRRHLGEFEEGRQERGRALDDARQQLEQATARAEAADWTILRAESEVANSICTRKALPPRPSAASIIARRCSSSGWP